MRTLNSFMILLLLVAFSCTPEENRRPNVVLIFLDDSGWADFEVFGDQYLETPHIAEMALEGCAYHNFYVPQAICSASRSALMTGCYPGRTKVFGAHGPGAWGLDTCYATMGEVFQEGGYATAIFGKWHCGDAPQTRSHARGFEESCGLMYSNDMWKHHPENPEYWGREPLQFWENGKVVIEDVEPGDQAHLTRWYTEHALDFISRHAHDPFFLYVPHSMPHVPLFCSPEFEGKSGKGLYGDVMLEIDWSVGQIMQALEASGLEENTMVILTSDNGPWISYGDHAGFTPFREAKGTSFDGGIRSACLIKYPEGIEAGSISERMFMSVDLLPTLARLCGIELPENEIDGKDVWPLISGESGAENPQDYYAFSNGREFQGIISGDGRWKLHLPHSYRVLESDGTGGMPGKYGQAHTDTALFDMLTDPMESLNLLHGEPVVAASLLSLAEEHKERFYE